MLCPFGAFLLDLEKVFKGGQKSSLAKKSSPLCSVGRKAIKKISMWQDTYSRTVLVCSISVLYQHSVMRFGQT